MRRSRLLAAVLAAAGSLAAAAAAGPTRPLSTLGLLRPAPPPGRLGPELVPVPDAPPLAPAGAERTRGRPIDGIRCRSNEPMLFHVHVHLTLFVDGKPRAVPAGIGIWPPVGPRNYRDGQFGEVPGNCLYWLVTRYADGLVHVEAPVRRSFVLGELFDVWGQPLGRSRLGPARGPVTAIVDGRVWTGDPRAIPLAAHAQIQLEVGRPLVAPERIDWPGRY
jgi:hypothetical protein